MGKKRGGGEERRRQRPSKGVGAAIEGDRGREGWGERICMYGWCWSVFEHRGMGTEGTRGRGEGLRWGGELKGRGGGWRGRGVIFFGARDRGGATAVCVQRPAASGAKMKRGGLSGRSRGGLYRPRRRRCPSAVAEGTGGLRGGRVLCVSKPCCMCIRIIM